MEILVILPFYVHSHYMKCNIIIEPRMSLTNSIEPAYVSKNLKLLIQLSPPIHNTINFENKPNCTDYKFNRTTLANNPRTETHSIVKIIPIHEKKKTHTQYTYTLINWIEKERKTGKATWNHRSRALAHAHTYYAVSMHNFRRVANKIPSKMLDHYKFVECFFRCMT